MKVKFDVELELSAAQKRVMRWSVVVGVAVGALGLGVAFAGLPTDTSWIGSGKPVKSASLLQNLNDIQSQLTDPTCPPGYTQDTSVTTFVDCKNGGDEVVKVGTKGTAFWVDRFEASVWDSASSPVMQYGVSADDYPNSFPDTGQWTAQVFAISKAGVMPSSYLTWFQANAACRASGKRLPTGSEWLSAAMGTADPGSTGTTPSCNVSGTGKSSTGTDTSCVSTWGAMDMIGNVREWTDEWYAGLGDGTTTANPWPTSGVSGSYNGDGTSNITATETSSVGLPAAAIRGGNWSGAANAGIFNLALDSAPSFWGGGLGFRCVIPK